MAGNKGGTTVDGDGAGVDWTLAAELGRGAGERTSGAGATIGRGAGAFTGAAHSAKGRGGGATVGDGEAGRTSSGCSTTGVCRTSGFGGGGMDTGGIGSGAATGSCWRSITVSSGAGATTRRGMTTLDGLTWACPKL